jgi:hypothetical protein
MNRVFILVSLVICLAFGCKVNKEKTNKHFFLEDRIPTDILTTYLEKASLTKIENGVDSFEVRKWYPFYYTDSFPGALERFYYQDGSLKGEYYLFSNINGKILMTRDELKGLNVEKYKLSIPLRFLDSLQNQYNLGQIDTFNIDILRKRNANIFSTRTPRNVFFEQSSPSNYYGIFITEPGLYPGLHPSLDMYASFAKFTFDSLCQRDTGFNKWFDEKARRIAGLK